MPEVLGRLYSVGRFGDGTGDSTAGSGTISAPVDDVVGAQRRPLRWPRARHPKMAAWNALPEERRRGKEREGIAAWKAWVEKHQGAIVGMAGPLGKTKQVTQRGVEDVSNAIGAYTVARAESHEAAAKLFENHPHFVIFSGESVEIMPVLPIPGA